MGSLEKLFVAPLVFSFFVAYALTPYLIRLAWKYGLVDNPKGKTHPKIIHKTAIPRAGGAAIFVSVLLSILIFLPFDQHVKGILAGAFLITVVGLLDDKYDINPYVRLLLQLAAASMPIIAGIGISFISNPLGPGIVDLSFPRYSVFLFGATREIWILSDFFALFWIVALMNFLNMGAKGVDGQLTGVVAIAALTIAALSFQFSADIAEWPVIILAAITAGAYLGFLPHHIFPQKIMPSFSGSNLAGYLLGVLSILTTTKVGVLGLVLAVPLIDTSYTIVRRVLSGKSPVWGDAGHLHHKLMSMGLSKAETAYFYWTASLVLGVLALQLSSTFKLYTIGGTTILLGLLLLWLRRFTK